MKKLVVMRHASYTHAGSSSDYERMLSATGKQEAQAQAEYFKKVNFQPDLILTSSAVRAKQTADILSKKLFDHSNDLVLTEKKLYLAESEIIKSCINEIVADFENVILVGHNPGVSIFARIMSGTDILSFPPSGFAMFDADCDDWLNISPESLKLTFVSLGHGI